MKKMTVFICVVSVCILAGCKASQYGDGFREFPYVSRGESIAAQLHKMEIGDELNISISRSFVRVPGGWVFSAHRFYGRSACFIPYSDEGKE